MKYYFLVYQWKRLSPHFGNPVIANRVVDKHPMDWLQEMIDFDETKDRERFPVSEEFQILWFTEIPFELWEKYQDWD